MSVNQSLCRPEVAAGVLHQPRSTWLLVQGALNGRAFALLLAGLGGLSSVLNPWLEEAELLGAVEWVIDGGVDGVASWLVVAVAALVRYWNLALTVDGDRYLFSHGLAETPGVTTAETSTFGSRMTLTASGRRHVPRPPVAGLAHR